MFTEKKSCGGRSRKLTSKTNVFIPVSTLFDCKFVIIATSSHYLFTRGSDSRTGIGAKAKDEGQKIVTFKRGMK